MKILVAGIGNVFFGDDGWGVEVARALAAAALPEGVRVVDFGIRGLDLTYALLGGYDVAILVDIVRRGGSPGTLYVLEPEVGAAGAAGEGPESHAIDPVRAIALARAIRDEGESVATMRLVGCEPGVVDEDELAMGLSPPVAAAVAPGAALVTRLVHSLLDERRGSAAHA